MRERCEKILLLNFRKELKNKSCAFKLRKKCDIGSGQNCWQSMFFWSNVPNLGLQCLGNAKIDRHETCIWRMWPIFMGVAASVAFYGLWMSQRGQLRELLSETEDILARQDQLTGTIT